MVRRRRIPTRSSSRTSSACSLNRSSRARGIGRSGPSCACRVSACRVRVLRLMRENGLLAPTRSPRVRGPYPHDGTITTERPNEMWGTDATTVLTGEGTATVFIAIDHGSADCVGIHAARYGTRFEALEVISQGVHEHFGSYDAGVATGLKLRHDHGSQFLSHHYQQEIRFLGIESSPSFIRMPGGMAAPSASSAP